ncbi:MAG: deoxyribodipyrimidine photolyase [Myxococcota bacterium]
MTVPLTRIRALNDARLDPSGSWVLYWMVASRRTRFNPSLERAIELARAHGRPLVVLEALRCGYRWASDRHHRFVLDGMRDNRAALEAAGVTVVSWVEPSPGAGSGLLERLASRAVCVVSDDWPGFFVPRMTAAAAARLPVLVEAVDGTGILPLSATDRAFPTAASFRRHLQKTVLPHLAWRPEAEPLHAYSGGRATLPDGFLDRWAAPAGAEDGWMPALAELPIDHTVRPTGLPGGPIAAARMLDGFLDERLARYPDDRKHPDDDASSHLSPYLHYGHVSAHEVLWRVLDGASWSPDRVGAVTGSRGWWGLPEDGESYVDELVTWRELGHVFAHHRPHDYDQYGSIPDWARQTLDEHASDPRKLVSFADLEAARSPDPLWNAAQQQLRQSGLIHNYLRMLWGKKVLEWTKHPSIAFDWLTELNNRYALDGRDPNSACGIAWVFGRHDRAWGPERPIFGKVRYMTSDSTRKKLHLAGWLARWGRGNTRRVSAERA